MNSTKHHPTIADSVFIQFVIASTYTLFALIGASQPASQFGAAFQGWLKFTFPAVQIVFALAPAPHVVGGDPILGAVGLYRHVLTACFALAGACFLRSRRHLSSWSERIDRPLSSASGHPGVPRLIALVGYRRMLLGIAAVIYLAMLLETRIPTMSDYLYRTGWTYIRAPLLTSIAFAFACYAAALRHSLRGPKTGNRTP